MPLESVGGILQETTPDACRKATKAYVQENLGSFDVYLVPDCGTFSMPEVLVGAGVSPDKIHCSDISLYSSVIGYVMDPTKRVSDLGFVPQGEDTQELLADLPFKTDFDRAACILMAVQYTQLVPKSEFVRWQRLQFLTDREKIHAQYVDVLRKMYNLLGGITYEMRGGQDYIETEAENSRAFIWYEAQGGRKKQAPHYEYAWKESQVPELVDTEEYLKSFGTRPACMAVFCVDTYKGSIFDDPNWRNLFVDTTGKWSHKHFVILNRDPEVQYMKRKRITPVGNTEEFPRIYDGHEITADSEIEFVETDRITALYYYDIFVKKLGITTAEAYYLFVIDGQVAGISGFNFRHLRVRNIKILHEVFGLICTSDRYKRLNRLRLKLMTSKAFVSKIQETHLVEMMLPEIEQVQTTCLSPHPEVMSHRGIFKRVLQEREEDGWYRLVYRADVHYLPKARILYDWLEGQSGK